MLVAPVSWSTWSFGCSRMRTTPDAIAQRYPTATLADIYAVIAYYLRHQEDLDAYLDTREQQAQGSTPAHLSPIRGTWQTCAVACAPVSTAAKASTCCSAREIVGEKLRKPSHQRIEFL